MVGYIAGAALASYGLFHWLPLVNALRAAKKEIEGHSERLEAAVAAAVKELNRRNLELAEEVLARTKAEQELRLSEVELRELSRVALQNYEAERERIAVEIHDRIAQTVAAVSHQLEALHALVGTDPRVQPISQRALALQRSVIQDARRLMNELYPPNVGDLGLQISLKEDLAEFQAETGCQALLEGEPVDGLGRDEEMIVYRIFREALTNVRNHAQGVRKVLVSLRPAGRQVRLKAYPLRA
jgi:signal transduction histidine kinase